MKQNRQVGVIPSGALAVLLLFGIAGCASPAKRISQDPDLFAQFSAEDQDKIRAGTIDIGFSAPMVQMALGRPSRVYRRTTSDGTQEIWSYRELTSGYYSHAYAFARLCPSYQTCSRRRCPYFHHAYQTPLRSIERMRVTFEQEVVTTIEALDSESSRD